MTFQFRSPHYPPGPTAMRILARAYDERGFIKLDTQSEQVSARKLHENGYLDRHTKISSAYRISTYGEGYLAHISTGAMT